MNGFYDNRERQFEEYLRDGITAAKSGQRRLSQSLLERAIYLKNNDARPYIWLSATTDDPQEQIEYLEKAVAVDPSNIAARRGLALLTGKIERQKLMPEGAGLERGSLPQEVEASGEALSCPKCGGRMTFNIQRERLSCEYCGYAESAPDSKIQPEEAEQTLDFYVPTTRGHRWAAAQQLFKCERCGALSLLPPGQKAVECSYCGANQLVHSPEQEELIEPQLIALMQIDEQQANQIARRWLSKGLFSPDGFFRSNSTLRLHPAYYSCWTFDGVVEARWTCEVAEGSGNSKRWLPTSGVEARFFNDVLVSGVSALPTRELDRLAPFYLEEMKEFKPEYLAGWPAVLYDCSLSDASLVGREKVLYKLRPELYSLVEMGREKRNLNISGGNWSGLTFKHILLPLWTGVYQFQGKEYRLMINGQTGKIMGSKPKDAFKQLMALFSLLAIILLIFLTVWMFAGDSGLF